MRAPRGWVGGGLGGVGEGVAGRPGGGHKIRSWDLRTYIQALGVAPDRKGGCSQLPGLRRATSPASVHAHDDRLHHRLCAAGRIEGRGRRLHRGFGCPPFRHKGSTRPAAAPHDFGSLTSSPAAGSPSNRRTWAGALPPHFVGAIAHRPHFGHRAAICCCPTRLVRPRPPPSPRVMRHGLRPTPPRWPLPRGGRHSNRWPPSHPPHSAHATATPRRRPLIGACHRHPPPSPAHPPRPPPSSLSAVAPT